VLTEGSVPIDAFRRAKQRRDCGNVLFGHATANFDVLHESAG
jgi:hypothetical protein